MQNAPPRFDPALVVILAGVCAALHVGKLPPAIPALQEALGLSLVQAGFLLSMVQLAGMTVGVAFGVLAEGLGPRRSMLVGLAVLALASGAGALATGVTMLMVLRGCEGFGFLLVVLAAPGMVKRLVAPSRLNLMLGLWSAFMPVAITLALLGGPWVIAAFGWPGWWGLLAVVCAGMALWLARAVPAQRVAPAVPGAPASGSAGGPTATSVAPSPSAAFTTVALAPPALPLTARLARTLAAGGPWLLAAAFAVYAGQWLAVVGFLPTMHAQAGSSLAMAGTLTALAAAANIVGNVVAGRLLHAGASSLRLLVVGYVAMGAGAFLAFVCWPGSAVPVLPPVPSFIAVLVFSGVGGLVPATLFTLTVPATPPGGSLPVTVGWMQQWSALGQFGGPPLVAALAALAGGWHYTWVVTSACSLLGLVLSGLIARYVVGAAGLVDASGIELRAR